MRVRLLVLMILALTLAVAMPTAAMAQQPWDFPQLSFPASAAPVLDGTVSPNEWDGAGAFAIGQGVLMVQHTLSDIYLLLDVTSDTTEDNGGQGNNLDYFWLTFDVDRNGQITPNVDINYGYDPYPTPVTLSPPLPALGYQYYLGPSNWTGLQTNVSSQYAVGFGDSLFSVTPHRIWEFRIDRAEIAAIGADVVYLGVRTGTVLADDPTTGVIPSVESPPGFPSSFTNNLWQVVVGCGSFGGDVDGDGYCADFDNCPTVPNPGQEDGDEDGIGTACDVCPDDYLNDQDKDGVCAGVGFLAPKIGDFDNCPEAPNQNQQDTDDPCPPGSEFCDPTATDGGDVCDACPTEYDPAATPQNPSTSPCAAPLVTLPGGSAQFVRIIESKEYYTFGETIGDVEICLNYANVGGDTYVIRPNCSNVNPKLTLNNQELPRRYPLARPLGIACPDLDNPDPTNLNVPDDFIDVIAAQNFTEIPYCIICPIDDYFVIDPAEMGVQSGTAVQLELTGRYVTKGIIDPDPAYSTPQETDYCLGEDGRIDLTPIDQDLGSLPLTIAYPQEVNIDIKPDSLENTVNLGSNGNIPVAILSSATFDATQVNPYTVSLSGATVMLRGKAEKPASSQTDVNGDGLMDLLVHVDTQALMLSSGETRAYLKAQTYGMPGIYVMGSDSIKVVPQ